MRKIGVMDKHSLLNVAPYALGDLSGQVCQCVPERNPAWWCIFWWDFSEWWGSSDPRDPQLDQLHNLFSFFLSVFHVSPVSYSLTLLGHWLLPHVTLITFRHDYFSLHLLYEWLSDLRLNSLQVLLGLRVGISFFLVLLNEPLVVLLLRNHQGAEIPSKS